MGKTIKLTAKDGHRLDAWRTGPTDAKRALVLAQEIFGVNHHIRQTCEAFAAQGYAVVAPALFDRAEREVELGYDAEGIARGRKLRAAIPESGTLADIEAAADTLKELPTGIIGYCWGGTVAWWGATRSTVFRAAVGWYGGGIAAGRTETPHCPVQLHFGETDASIPLSDVEAIRAAQPGIEIFTYPRAGHGFGCNERASYDASAAAEAQARTLAFLGHHLRRSA